MNVDRFLFSDVVLQFAVPIVLCLFFGGVTELMARRTTRLRFRRVLSAGVYGWLALSFLFFVALIQDLYLIAGEGSWFVSSTYWVILLTAVYLTGWTIALAQQFFRRD